MSKFTTKKLLELAKLFFKLGIMSFGGPAAHIAMMENEVVKRRNWLTTEHFLDLVGATNLIPGPNSTEMAIHIGYIYAGWLGLIIAGVSFILPAVLITAIFAWIYVNYGTLPEITPLLYGIKPVVLAIIFNALWRLGKKAITTKKLSIIAVIVLLLSLSKVDEISSLFIGGIFGMFWLKSPELKPPKNNQNLLIFGLTTASITASNALPVQVSLWQLGLFFLKIGSILFGGGYVLIAFLQGELVEQYHWLTQQQLLDAIAIGQFTPGPLSSTATFIGYIIAGFPGAIVSTIGIFFPAFIFVAALNPLIPKLRSSPWTKAFLDAINVSSLALMASVTISLGITTLTEPKYPFVDAIALAITLVSALLTIRFNINSIWLVLGGAAIGLIVKNFFS
jgi:chromate transporter